MVCATEAWAASLAVDCDAEGMLVGEAAAAEGAAELLGSWLGLGLGLGVGAPKRKHEPLFKIQSKLHVGALLVAPYAPAIRFDPSELPM